MVFYFSFIDESLARPTDLDLRRWSLLSRTGSVSSLLSISIVNWGPLHEPDQIRSDQVYMVQDKNEIFSSTWDNRDSNWESLSLLKYLLLLFFYLYLIKFLVFFLHYLVIFTSLCSFFLLLLLYHQTLKCYVRTIFTFLLYMCSISYIVVQSIE